MSATRPLEQQILESASALIDQSVKGCACARIDVLEAAASRLGGFQLGDYRNAFPEPFTLTVAKSTQIAERLITELSNCGIPTAVALTALARSNKSTAQQRESGSYYTDFRLACQITMSARTHLIPGARVIDPASGTGILLVAATLAACGSDRHRRSTWLAESVTAVDIDPEALRSARLALSALTSDLGVVRQMVSSWRCEDSLLSAELLPNSYDVVVGNPPWEKVKLSRHEFLQARGVNRHYGQAYDGIDAGVLSASRDQRMHYSTTLAQRYSLLGKGESDLYKVFLELFIRLVRPDGCVSVLVPAGLIRSQGTEGLRRFLYDHARDLSVTIIDNRARFFAIDSRFKFLQIVFKGTAGSARRSDFQLVHATGTATGLCETGRVLISRASLLKLRSDLTVPEVKSDDEWRVFRVMSKNAAPPATRDSPWKTDIVREVDMTRNQGEFVIEQGSDSLALVEGRMIHQHRFGAKAYRHGTGRRAIWDCVAFGRQELKPQFWYPCAALPARILRRTSTIRAGFCDITGQTNERSLLASIVPAGVVCGNKVPTVTFPNDQRDNRLFLWLAIVNSLPFDWALRRLVTTSVNYFLLKGVPFPSIEPDSLPGERLADAARRLHLMATGSIGADGWKAARLRVSIDVAVLAAYGLDFDDLALMLKDFPLLDRGQPAIFDEQASTVTRDLLLEHAAARFERAPGFYAERAQAARAIGAVPYVPSEFSTAMVGLSKASHG